MCGSLKYLASLLKKTVVVFQAETIYQVSLSVDSGNGFVSVSKGVIFTSKSFLRTTFEPEQNVSIQNNII